MKNNPFTRENFQFNTAQYSYLGYMVFAVLFVFAALFWKERAVCMDVAFQAFWLINEGTFQVQVNRFGVALVQWLPLLFIKLGASVEWILFVYSLSFVFLQLVFYFLLSRVFRNDFLALAMAFLFVAQVNGAFYWTISEYQQALGLLLVFFAFVLQRQHLNIAFFAIAIPLIITLVFYHPLIFFVFGFLWAFFWLHYKLFQRWEYYAIIIVMLLTWLVKSIFFKNWYDSAKNRYLLQNLEQYYPAYWKLDSNLQFWEHCKETFFFFPILFLGLLIFYIQNKAWLKALLIISSTLIYLFFVNITHASGAEYFYIESFYFPMTLFVIIPLIFEFGHKWQARKWVIKLIFVFFVLRLFVIGNGHEYFETRYQKVGRLVALCQAQPTQKLMATEQIMRDQALEMNWAVPFETLFYSIIEKSEQQQSLFIYKNLHSRQKEVQHSKDILFYMNKFYKYKDLNTNYFDFKEEEYLEIQKNGFEKN